MTREEIYTSCLEKLGKSNSLLMELATGTGKSRLSILLVNHLCDTVYKGKKVNMLLLVAKTVHKQTWREEFEKWGGIKANVTIECYESLKKHANETFDILVLDECHHVGSDIRLDLLSTLHFRYMIGLSATIPRNLKRYFQYKYHSQIVSCDIVEAIEDDILPEPEILLFPLQLDNTRPSETWEINARSKGPVVKGEYRELWKFRRNKVHAVVSCTQKQKLMEYNSLIDWEKKKYMSSRNKAMEQTWLYHCGKRLEFLSDCKVKIVQVILKHLDKYRTITFCKTINQSELLGKNCIHSQNRKSTEIYDKFNQKKINHITAVNILNENANLVDCKYAIFANLSSSEIIQVQRTGRALRHKHPVIIIPYYVNTREDEIIKKMLEGYNQEYIKEIKSLRDII